MPLKPRTIGRDSTILFRLFWCGIEYEMSPLRLCEIQAILRTVSCPRFLKHNITIYWSVEGQTASGTEKQRHAPDGVPADIWQSVSQDNLGLIVMTTNGSPHPLLWCLLRKASNPKIATGLLQVALAPMCATAKCWRHILRCKKLGCKNKTFQSGKSFQNRNPAEWKQI